ncbi:MULTISPECIES: hypothetical protein [unclassified Duganella]|uniref:hypothetical protein n=1 Tax=unclassified Duganella TaxID=2636909 RepID=UPI0006FDFFA5|nr:MULTISPECIES: hypothetical protein [unclassified Duganella]KQV53933.1 hypothetical protein ASD07_05140 [Duganella sp. Root336D2]KRB98145.1 hypothetical protein ASE26_24820 [Duganella sp. Root198D2]
MKRWLLAAIPLPALAHGFGQRFDLPLPLWMFMGGAGATVAATFLLLARQRNMQPRAPERAFTLLERIPLASVLATALRLAVLALYLLVICAGFAGAQNPFKNIAPAMVWAIWWVGMAFVSALLGDLWALVNPLDTVYRWTLGERPAKLAWPQWAGVWPAALLFLAFVNMELNWEGSEQPASLAAAMLAYSCLSWLAMFLFGRRTWLAHGEVFAVVFGLLARFAPNQVHNGRWQLRPFGAGLLLQAPLGWSHIVLVMLMLASVSFDGLLETQAWLDLQGALALPPALLRGAALCLLPAVFLLAYLAVCRAIAWCGGGAALAATAGWYVLTLVPIAIAYHFAHYLSFLAMAGQYLVPLASDPLNLGWDLFGTRFYFIRLGIVDARMVWYVSLFAIVAGHVAAVWLGHQTALRQFGPRATRSQLPMLALMVAYTLLSLWIIAQPIVNG